MRGRAFTLVELVIVVLILSILAAVAIVAIVNSSTTAEINATMANVRAIEEAAARYYAQTGKWPSFTYWYAPTVHNLPGDFAGYISPAAFRRKPPIGGLGYSWYNLSGYTGVAIFDPAPNTAKWQELDALFDDGNTATGSIIIAPSDVRYLVFLTGSP